MVWAGGIALILFLGVMSGFWAGLIGLWKTRRGPGRSLMAIGVTLGSLGPICLFSTVWIRMGNGGSSDFAAAQIANMIGGLLVPTSLVIFSVGFALHGFAVARMASRAEELEQLTAAMSEEIDSLRKGGPTA